MTHIATARATRGKGLRSKRAKARKAALGRRGTFAEKNATQ